jgi:hypothetical protein
MAALLLAAANPAHWNGVSQLHGAHLIAAGVALVAVAMLLFRAMSGRAIGRGIAITGGCLFGIGGLVALAGQLQIGGVLQLF